MSMYRLTASQSFPISRETAWEFLSDPANLKVITQPSMGFEILCGAERKIYPGQIIQYKVNPFPGYSTKWVTEITHVKDGVYFVDEQRFGPYALWHHKHFIHDIEGGVEMEDIIDYKLPLGILGDLAHPLVVKKQLVSIFQFREEQLNKRFGTLENTSKPLNIIKI
ncbi:Ligand-binding SRPBCC domain-containing protein [Muriicola jejuensis]|uniref:Cell division inhibitor n=1 Tax=Muriicola jejuensis TaxID=504488 RepID=A0A6P0UMI5_9FLAO|nr:SRPBCC family protein [Muriicola jejuensis]NER11476.1 cell division inhibitor [Muriicola jejuensis]SMP20466.1 Ligand-binding SRPBCC domain-containing protein [Muriicola jejuensis]